MTRLERLTEAAVRRAEGGGKAAGWYALCSRGYTPAEVGLYAEKANSHDIRHQVREYAERHELAIPATCARARATREPRPVIDWREAFRATVMRTGLDLNLTQPMLEFICAVADNVTWDRREQRRFHGGISDIVTAAALEKRGLICRKAEITRERLFAGDSIHELTEAGRCVVELLKVTGVFREADLATEKRAGGGR